MSQHIYLIISSKFRKFNSIVSSYLACLYISQVSVKKHGPSNKEIIEKKIRKKDNRKKYVDIERDMINISHSEYIVKYFGYLEDQVIYSL